MFSSDPVHKNRRVIVYVYVDEVLEDGLLCENILQKFGDDNVVIFAPTPSISVVHRLRALAAIKRPGSIVTGRGCSCTFDNHWEKVCVYVLAHAVALCYLQVLESYHIDVVYTHDEMTNAEQTRTDTTVVHLPVCAFAFTCLFFFCFCFRQVDVAAMCVDTGVCDNPKCQALDRILNGR